MAFDDLTEAEKLKTINDAIAQIKAQLDNIVSGQQRRHTNLSEKIDKLAKHVETLSERLKDKPD